MPAARGARGPVFAIGVDVALSLVKRQQTARDIRDMPAWMKNATQNSSVNLDSGSVFKDTPHHAGNTHLRDVYDATVPDSFARLCR